MSAQSTACTFHKAALQSEADGLLAAEVRKAIASAQQRIVGVVVNAIDDHLPRGEQLDLRWSHDSIKILPALLHEAKEANRTVILLSDHGHVLDCGTQTKSGNGGERWRLDDGKPDANELRVTGQRVVLPQSRSLIAP